MITFNSQRVWPERSQVEKPEREDRQFPISDSSVAGSDETLRHLLNEDDNCGLPCVLFQTKASLEIISVSDSVTDLFGFDRSAVVCQPLFLQERVAAEDRLLFKEKILELETSGSISFIHRFVVASGLPVWVCHSLRKVDRKAESLVNGCLVPIGTTSRLFSLEQEVVSRFIHKLGNHFQLLSLVFSSLKSSLSNSRESDVLEETLGKAIDLTRVFSECNQEPSWISDVQLLEIMKAAAESRVNEFAASGVSLRVDLTSVPDDATIKSSPYLLEAAFGHVLQNALEATGNGGTVEFGGRLVVNGSRSAARVYIKDTGCGIPLRQQLQVIFPFFTTKKGRDGLGLTVASRFVEMHGGALQIESREGKGTEIVILLPLERGRDVFCA